MNCGKLRLAAVAAASVAALSTAQAPTTKVSDLSHEQVMQLLENWDLDAALSGVFAKYGVNGETLSMVNMQDCDSGTWLLASSADADAQAPPQIFWKQFCNKLRSSQGLVASDVVKRRALEDSLSELLTTYADVPGLWMQRDTASFKLGTEGDVMVARSSLGEMLLLAAQTLLAGDIEVTGAATLNAGATVTGDVSATGNIVSDGSTLSAVTIGTTAETDCSFPRTLFDPADSKMYVCDGTDWWPVGGEEEEEPPAEPLTTVTSCLEATEEGLYFIDPTGTADYYTALCYEDGGMRLRSVYDTYSTYFDGSCGGGDDADCLPSASDGCYTMSSDGTVSDLGCADDSLSHKKTQGEVTLEYVDEAGKTFDAATLGALSKLYTTSGNYNQIWMYDSTEGGYGVVVNFAGDTGSSAQYTDYFLEDDNDVWSVNNQATAMPNWFGSGRIITSVNAGSASNFGLALILADGAMRLTPLTNILKSCIGAPAGDYLLNPAGIADAFPATCDGEGGLTLRTNADGYSTYYNTCGGTADTDCLPSCRDDCVLSTVDGITLASCCDDPTLTWSVSHQSVTISYVTAAGFAIPAEQINALVDQGVDSSATTANVWTYDGTDGTGYDFSVSMYSQSFSSMIVTTNTDDDDDVWLDQSSSMSATFTGPNMVPSGMHAGEKTNWGIFATFPERKLILSAKTPKSCNAINFEGIYDIDPAQTGTPFPVYCDGQGSTYITSAYDGYSTWGPNKCGGTADSDCYPTCSDNCYLMDMDNNDLDTCCDEGNVKATETLETDFLWVDNDGTEIPEEQLVALALMTDSSMTDFEMYLYDGGDAGVYNPSVSFYGGGVNFVTDHETETVNDAWEINTDTQYIHGVVGMHRIPKTLIAGTGDGANHGLVFMLAGATLKLTPDTDTRRTCLGVPTDGIYLLDPINTGHAFPAQCSADGTMTIWPEYSTMTMYGTSKCGGDDLDPCQPTCANGCTDGATGVCCDELEMYDTGVMDSISMDIRFVDAKGHFIDPDMLGYFGDNGFDTTDSAVQIWVHDGNDNSYTYYTTGYGSNTVEQYVDWYNDETIENDWDSSDQREELQTLITGVGIIPMTFYTDTTYNVGIWLNFVGGELQVAPPATQTCAMYSDNRLVMIDPAGTGEFGIECDAGKTKVRTNRFGYSVYYSQCGGGDLEDCIPSCEDGCVYETEDGTKTSICCDTPNHSESKSSQSVTYKDAFGNTLDSTELDALGNAFDSSWSHVQVWMFDAEDANNYELTVDYYGSSASTFEHATSYDTENQDDWIGSGADTYIQYLTDDLEGVVGMNKIPTSFGVGTKENWGLFFGIGGSHIILSPPEQTFSSCFDVPYSGTFLIDPAGSGKAFPLRCGADGAHYLTTGYSGMAVYYSSCGGGGLSSCRPSCEDGCYLQETAGETCCDASTVQNMQAQSTIDIPWIDEIGNLIPTQQLDAIAALDLDSSVATEETIWVYDAVDASGYEITVEFYGGVSDATLTTPSDWNDAFDVQDMWHDDNEVDLSELKNLLTGANRIPKTFSVGDKQNWGVWWHFAHDTLILSPA